MAQVSTKQTVGQATRNPRKRELQRLETTPAARRAGTLAIIRLGQTSVAAALKAAEAQAREAARIMLLEARATEVRETVLVTEHAVA